MKLFFIIAGIFLVGASYFVRDMSEVMILWRGDDIDPNTMYWVMLRTSYTSAALAIVFAISIFTPKNIVQIVFGELLKGMPEYVFKNVNYMWIGFFIVVAIVNYYFMTYHDTRGWCMWKLLGAIPLFVTFCIGQLVYFSRQAKKNNITFEAT